MMSDTSADLPDRLRALLDRGHGDLLFTAAALRVAVDGTTIVSLDMGELARVDDDGADIPPADRAPVTTATPYDLASLTKVFTVHALLTLVDRGDLALDDPIADALAPYRTPERRAVTLRHLVTHSSGLPAEWRGWRTPLEQLLTERDPSALQEAGPLTTTPLAGRRDELIADLLETPLSAEVGAVFRYSDAGMNTAMALGEAVTGRRWDDVVAETTLEPLRLGGVTWGADPRAAAATEYEPHEKRGVVRGVVHDETAWSLGGIAGSAGLFAPVDDVLQMAEALRTGVTHPLAEGMWADQTRALFGRDTVGLPGRDTGRFGTALGLRIGETAWMGDPATGARGHTGFTGTSLQTDREHGITVVLLTNRVHPTREGPGVHRLRRHIADAVYEAVLG